MPASLGSTPNGEYTNTFRDMSKVRVYAVEPSEGVEQLRVPPWFWNSAEWSAFTQASAKAQHAASISLLDVDSQLKSTDSLRPQFAQPFDKQDSKMKVQN